MAKQVLDIRAGKGMTTSQSNEFLRNANGGERLKRWSGNYDSTREHLNFEIKKSENEQLSQTIEGQQTVIREQRATLSGLEKDIKHATARFKATVKEMQQMGYMMMATDAKHRVAKYHEFLSSLPLEQRQVARQTGDILFDGSIAETIMDDAVQVASIAAALYLGYLDAATKISQSGGGGGGPGTGWCHF